MHWKPLRGGGCVSKNLWIFWNFFWVFLNGWIWHFSLTFQEPVFRHEAETSDYLQGAA